MRDPVPRGVAVVVVAMLWASLAAADPPPAGPAPSAPASVRPEEPPPEPISDAPERRRDAAATVDEEEDWAGEDEDAPPPRVWLSLGAGTGLRLARERDFAQDAFSPAFTDLFGALVLPGSDWVRHGAGVGVATNLSADGGVRAGVDALDQWVLAAEYLARFGFDRAWVGTVKAHVDWVVAPSASLGVGADLGLVWFVLAGFGPYVELGASMFMGGEATFHPILTGELGLTLEYEVL